MRHIILFAFMLLAYVESAHAQRQFNIPARCGPVADVSKSLEKEYGERLDQVGVTKSGAVLNFYIGDDSWTVTVRIPEAPGLECVLTSGEDWQRMPEGKGT